MTTQRILTISLLAAAAIQCQGRAQEAVIEEPSEVVEFNSRREGRRTLIRWPGAEAEAEEPESDEEEPLATDRPDFTEASSTVGKGRLQIEMGYTYLFDDTSGVQTITHSFPETLVRLGILAEWLELRFAWNYGVETTTEDGLSGTINGSNDFYVGAKFFIAEQRGILPEFVIMPQMLVPSDSALSEARDVLPGISFLYSWELNELMSLAGSTQFNSAHVGADHTFVETAQSASIAWSLSDRLGAYTEYFGFYPSQTIEMENGIEHYLDGGFTYLVSNDIQLDIRAGFGLNGGATDFFTGAGLSVRF